MDLKLNNKLVLVTGSTAGIGFAIADSLAIEGCRVIVDGISEGEVTEAIRKIHQVHPRLAWRDSLPISRNQRGPEVTIRRFPTIDILVNNLGRYEERPFEATSDADWQAIIEFNFMSGVRLCRHYLPLMLAAGWGRVIFLSSESGLISPSR